LHDALGELLHTAGETFPCRPSEGLKCPRCFATDNPVSSCGQPGRARCLVRQPQKGETGHRSKLLKLGPHEGRGCGDHEAGKVFTGHIHQHFVRLLSLEAVSDVNNVLIVYKYPEGYRISTHYESARDLIANGYSDAFRDLLNSAAAQGCVFPRFDANDTTLVEPPSFDW